jgi:hypothetical protein
MAYKIVNLSVAKKDFIASCILNIAKEYHRIGLLKWFIMKKIGNK